MQPSNQPRIISSTGYTKVSPISAAPVATFPKATPLARPVAPTYPALAPGGAYAATGGATTHISTATAGTSIIPMVSTVVMPVTTVAKAAPVTSSIDPRYPTVAPGGAHTSMGGATTYCSPTFCTDATPANVILAGPARRIQSSTIVSSGGCVSSGAKAIDSNALAPSGPTTHYPSAPSTIIAGMSSSEAAGLASGSVAAEPAIPLDPKEAVEETMDTFAETLNVTVRDPAGEIIGNFAVKPSSTVGELKADLVSICDADLLRQTLLHGPDILKNTSRWIDIPVTDGDTVTLAINPFFPFTDQTIRKAVADFCRGGEAKEKVEQIYGPISRWDTVEVTDMKRLLQEQPNFNEDISAWDVSKVTNMEGMFFRASAFNGDLSAWNVSRVTNMVFMFMNAESFNGDLSPWNVSNVTNMTQMFTYAKAFNGELSAWNVSNVAGMDKSMFYTCPARRPSWYV